MFGYSLAEFAGALTSLCTILGLVCGWIKFALDAAEKALNNKILAGTKTLKEAQEESGKKIEALSQHVVMLQKYITQLKTEQMASRNQSIQSEKILKDLIEDLSKSIQGMQKTEQEWLNSFLLKLKEAKRKSEGG